MSQDTQVHAECCWWEMGGVCGVGNGLRQAVEDPGRGMYC